MMLGEGNPELAMEIIQELILTRKADKRREAEEKRREGLRRIAEMNATSDHGLHPLRDLLPEEMWIQILGDQNLSPLDRNNMRKVHSVFQGLMEQTEIQDMLLMVIRDPNIRFLEWLGTDSILSLRQLSKSMRDGVDQCVEERLLNSLGNARKDSRFRFHKHLTSLSMYSGNETERKISAFTRGPIARRTSPHFLRTLTIDFSPPHYFASSTPGQIEQAQRDYPELFQNFHTIVTEFLERVGNQVLYFELHFTCLKDIVGLRGVPIMQVVDGLVREWLLFMPNLKWLGMRIDPQLHSSMPQDHLPHMPNLNALEGVLLIPEMSPTVEAILRANPQVKYLMNKDGLDYSYNAVPYSHPIVLSLALETVNLKFSSLRLIPEFQWQVKRMTLVVDLDASLEEVFHYLQQNFPTLEDLFLVIDHARAVFSVNEPIYLMLPNLKHFKITFGRGFNLTGDFHSFFAIHFLLHCAKLESLAWVNLLDVVDMQMIVLGMLGPRQTERLIDFQGEGGVMRWDMRTCNLWDIFPYLRRVSAIFRYNSYNITDRKGVMHMHRNQ